MSSEALEDGWRLCSTPLCSTPPVSRSTRMICFRSTCSRCGALFVRRLQIIEFHFDFDIAVFALNVGLAKGL